MSLYYKRGYSSNSRVVIETSIDDGLSWQAAGSPITGRTNNTPDSSFSPLSVPLPPDQAAVRVRFRHVWTGGAFYSIEQSPNDPVGIFIDDITSSGVSELESVNTVALAGGAGSFRFDSAALGEALVPGAEFRLRLRVTVGCHTFPFGPTKVVTVTGSPLSGFAAWEAYDYPVLTGGFDGDGDGDGTGNGAEYGFGTNPLRAGSTADTPETDPDSGVFRLRRPLTEPMSDVTYGAETSVDMIRWTGDGVCVTSAGGELTAEVPLGAPARFLRWRVTRR